MALHSPFSIPSEDIEALESSQAFRVLRSCLAGDAEYVQPPAAPGWPAHAHLHACVADRQRYRHRSTRPRAAVADRID